jgi:hypothetical protein
MDWQTAGVVAFVGAAVCFLVRRVLVNRQRRRRGAQGFVPLSSLRKRSDSHCH